MRRRWHVPDGLLPLLGGIWFFGWLPIDIILSALTTPCDSTGACGMNSTAPGMHPYDWFLIGWFGIVVVPAALVGLWLLVSLLWANRPRRVMESVEDMREAYRER